MEHIFNPRQLKAINNFMRGMRKLPAALDAGYKDAKVFENKHVKAEIRRRQNNTAKKCQVDSNWIIGKLKQIAEADLGEIVEVDPNTGDLRVDYRKMSSSLRYALTGLDINEYSEGRGKDRKPYTQIKIRKADQLRALEMLGKNLGLFTDKVEVDATEEAIELLQAARRRVKKEDDE